MSEPSILQRALQPVRLLQQSSMSEHESDDGPARPHAGAPERLDVPTLPPPSSRFVLPPPPSDLLGRLQAFLPQIRDANAALEQQQAQRPEGVAVEEPVVMEELSDDSTSDDSGDTESSSESDAEDDDGESSEEPATGGEETAAAVDDDLLLGRVDEGSLARLMDISSRPKVTKKKILVQEQLPADAPTPADPESMQAD